MTPLNIIFALIFALVSIFLCVQLIKFYRRFKRASDDSTAKNIYVIKYDEDKNVFPESKTSPSQPAPQPEGTERRKSPRRDYNGFVDFIKEGTLFKEQARDLSYTGMFIQSKTPEKYQKKDLLIMTFQTDRTGPQKRNGRIVRVSPTGIGVNFVN